MKNNNELIFIAEIGMNYNKNFALAAELIKQAKLSGADIAKFQLGWRDQPGELNYITKEDIEYLIKVSDLYKIDLMFSIISDNGLNLFDNFYFDKVKIASRTSAENLELTTKILSKNIETFISFGMSEVEEFPFEKRENHKYLYCISKYPTMYWDLEGFPENYDDSLFDGYSDHTLGIEACLLAIANGARIIEKHFTLDKSETNIRDHALSATPEEFKKLTEIGREIHRIKANIS